MKIETAQDAEDMLVGCTGQAIYVALFPILIVLQAIIGTCLWNWFIVLQFGWAAMTVPVAIGLNCLRALYRGQASKEKAQDEMTPAQLRRDAWRDVGFSLGFPLLAWLIGWLAHLAQLHGGVS